MDFLFYFLFKLIIQSTKKIIFILFNMKVLFSCLLMNFFLHLPTGHLFAHIKATDNSQILENTHTENQYRYQI